MDLSIVIVNWKSAAYLLNCVQSIYAHTKGLELEIIVVDNASYDGCGDDLARSFPMVKFVQLAENLGFSRANNVGARDATGRFLLFLNPDTYVHEGALGRMVGVLRAGATIGAVGCRLLNADSTVQTSCVQSFPTIWNQILDSELLRRVFPRAKLWGTAPLFGKASEATTVDVVSGACLLVRREVFTVVGGFTEDYFLYSDDVDFCHKVKRAGYEVRFEGDATVVHYGGGSSAQVSSGTFCEAMMVESRWRFFANTRRPYYKWLYRLNIVAAAIGRILALGFGTCVCFNQWQRKKLCWGIRKWYARLCWGVGAYSWGKRC